jgi:hypothetical protein
MSSVTTVTTINLNSTSPNHKWARWPSGKQKNIHQRRYKVIVQDLNWYEREEWYDNRQCDREWAAFERWEEWFAEECEREKLEIAREQEREVLASRDHTRWSVCN